MNITTTYKTNSNGTGQILAKAAGTQRTVQYNDAESIEQNHAAGAAAVIRAVVAKTPDQTVSAFVRSIDGGFAQHVVVEVSGKTVHRWDV